MRKVAPTIRLFLIGLAGGVLGSVLVLTTRSARAVVGTLDISGSSQTISGDVTAARIVDSANSSYFIDPAAAGTSMSLAGNASVSGSLTVASNQPFRPAFGPVKLDYKSGPDSWATGLIIQDTTGNVGIGTTTPAQKLSVAGTIESTTGGFKFPDGTTQTTAAGGAAVVTVTLDGASYTRGDGTAASCYADDPTARKKCILLGYKGLSDYTTVGTGNDPFTQYSPYDESWSNGYGIIRRISTLKCIN